MPDIAGIVLVGGQSRRMGRDKATLRWGEATLAEHLVARLAQRCAPIIVVAAPGQALPVLGARTVEDPVAHQGPLRGLATGLAAARPAEWAFACAIDMPHVGAGLIDELARHIPGQHDIIAAHDGVSAQPLAALYRTRLAPGMEAALAQGQRSPRRFLAGARTLEVPVPGLEQHLRNLNTPAEYDAALAEESPGP
ncbi:molybdenum cofactor guanylyltransferase [Hoyosella sp. G463]|uniref:Probable molybdenum cofactor guanylyltransferase n=1 Tax=Lolliginicoccus lacisalsi TaxID=2742202 RepID=A0A927PKG2_9ACTN|nr:molybdenum cofactor guanylyltransferase [Lolliginicoccus lacisalsi]MBD8505683.1 molybdenum cofactor guanylyltransferase [Lolliginicoccus lacisalsi]